MLHTDRDFLDATTAAVGRIERGTDAELVVVAAERSGHYRDLQHAGAALAALAALVAVLIAPVDVSPLAVPVELAVVYGLTYALLGGRPLLGRIVPAARARAQAETAARDAFFAECVAGTPNRTGVLVYISALERAVVVVPDTGIAQVVPPGELGPVTSTWTADDLPRFLAGLDRLGAVLAHRAPHRPDSDHTNIPDEPRVYA